MRRRFTYALTAGVLSSGAPAGLLGIRLAKETPEPVSLHRVKSELSTDRAAYVYVGAATAFIFALFGYILGRQADGLAELSETDPLTGLLNSRGFASRLRTELKRARRYREPVTLLFLDLDGLKSINDRHGHRAGSEALRQIADVIRSGLRGSDIGARWGGDEFTILAPKTPSDAAVALAERLRTKIASQVSPWQLTASIGVVTRDPVSGSVFDDSLVLMKSADAAMYEAKRRGKNMVVAAPLPPPPGASAVAIPSPV